VHVQVNALVFGEEAAEEADVADAKEMEGVEAEAEAEAEAATSTMAGADVQLAAGEGAAAVTEEEGAAEVAGAPSPPEAAPPLRSAFLGLLQGWAALAEATSACPPAWRLPMHAAEAVVEACERHGALLRRVELARQSDATPPPKLLASVQTEAGEIRAVLAGISSELSERSAPLI